MIALVRMHQEDNLLEAHFLVFALLASRGYIGSILAPYFSLAAGQQFIQSVRIGHGNIAGLSSP